MRNRWEATTRAGDDRHQRQALDNGEAPDDIWDALDGPDAEEALEVLCRHYQGLVMSQAYKFKSSMPSYISSDDLISYGQVGLLKAIRTYDPSKGPFRRYASTLIYGSTLDELRSQDWAPRGLRRDQRMIRQATAHLRNQPGRSASEPPIGAVAEHLGWDAARLESTLRQVSNSHHQALEGAETEDGVLVDSQDPVSDTMVTTLTDGFVDAFDGFDEATQYLLVRFYFCGDTLTTIAADTGLPLAVIRRIHTDAVLRVFSQAHGSTSVGGPS